MPFSSPDASPGDPRAAIIRDPLVVSPETAVLDAIAHMSHLTTHQASAETSAAHRLRANCAVVVDQRQVVGIFTEQDVVCLVAQQRPLQGVTLAQVMTRPVITLAEADFTDLSVATQQLLQHQCRHLPIVDGQGGLIGVVTYESLQVWDSRDRARLEAERQRLEAERQQAQAALRLSEQTNRAIIETMPDLLIRMDRQGYYSQISGGRAVQVKYPAPAPASEPDLFRVLPPTLAEERLGFAHQALETGQIQVYEQLFEVAGDQRWEEVRIAPLTDQEVLIIIRDVTGSKARHGDPGGQ